MYILSIIAIVTILINKTIIADNVCSTLCKCSPKSVPNIVHCDHKGWKTLVGFDFPSSVGTLTLNGNKLEFENAVDRAVIENLTNLIDLSINQNPLRTIPPFNNTKIRFLALQDTAIKSAEVPPSYQNSVLQTISLSQNKIGSINRNDFLVLSNSKLHKLHLDSASISKIDQNAFDSLTELQSLSLKNNQLKTCEFLTNIPSLGSIDFEGNQFTTIPPQLSTPRNIKTYKFIHNSISVIDELSPLYQWSRMNITNIKIYLSNNPFDCCSSLWFIRFLKKTPKFIGDVKSLKCATPSYLAGKLLINLTADDMNCGGDVPDRSWWTTSRIIAAVIGSVSIVVISIIGIITIVIFTRRRSSHSGYTEIDGINDPYYHIDASSSGGPAFPVPDEDDNDDGYSTTTYAGSVRTTTHSEAPTHSTGVGINAADGSHIGNPDIQDAARIPPHV